MSVRRVEVEWVDSMVLDYGEWGDRMDFEESMEPEAMTHRSCGYLISENEHAILVATSCYKSEQVDRAQGVALIPRGAILSLKDLRVDEKYRPSAGSRKVEG